jgi:hypothetical protein
MMQCSPARLLINHVRGRRAHVDEAVVEVEADEAGRDARVGDPGILDDAPDDVVRAGARRVVERGAQRRAGDRGVAVSSSRQS